MKIQESSVQDYLLVQLSLEGNLEISRNLLHNFPANEVRMIWEKLEPENDQGVEKVWQVQQRVRTDQSTFFFAVLVETGKEDQIALYRADQIESVVKWLIFQGAIRSAREFSAVGLSNF